MKDQQITLFDINAICEFIEQQNGELYRQFLVMLEEGFNKLPPSPNAMVVRFTNDAATIHGMCDELARQERIHAMPLRKGIYFFHILEVPGHAAGDAMVPGEAFSTIAKVYIVIDFENVTIQDATHNLKD